MKNWHLFVTRVLCIASIGLIAGCGSQVPPVTQGNVPSSELPVEYRIKPDIKALARNPNGYFWMSWSFCSIKDATAVAEAQCERHSGSACHLEFIGPNRVDKLDAAARDAIARKYESDARRHSAELSPEPLASVSYAALTTEKNGAEHVTTGRMFFDPRNICRGTIDGAFGEHHCSGEWVSNGREDPTVLFPMNGTVSLACGAHLSYSGRVVFIKNGAGKVTADGSDGSTMRAVYSRRADLSNLSRENFNLIWQAVK